MKKYISETVIENINKNGTLQTENGIVSMSNIDKYYEEHKELANSLGYYDYIENEKPLYNEETQYLEKTYSLNNNIITANWNIVNYTTE